MTSNPRGENDSPRYIVVTCRACLGCYYLINNASTVHMNCPWCKAPTEIIVRYRKD